MIRKFFPLDKNYLLNEAQLSLQDPLLTDLVVTAKKRYEMARNPLGIQDSFSSRIEAYHPKNLKPLYAFYETLAGIYRFRFGDNQLEILWDGQTHFEKYKSEWTTAFNKWITELCHREQFIQAVLDLTVFLSENRHAHLAENRMNFVMLGFFSEQQGFPELKLKKATGIVEMKVA